MNYLKIKIPCTNKSINVKNLYKHVVKDKNQMLIYTYSIGLAASAIAHIGGVNRNKNMTAEEKFFLIPQEISEAFVNIGIFLLLSLGLKNYTDSMFDYGKVKISGIEEIVQKYMKENNIKDKKDLLKNKITVGKILEKHLNEFNKFCNYKSGAGWVISIIGSIIACNLITPILRNSIAAKWQHKKFVKEEKANIQNSDSFVMQENKK